MAGENKVSQKVSLDTTPYLSQYRKMVSETKAGASSMSRDFQSAGTAFEDYANVVKQNSGRVIAQAGELGKAFAKNIGKGAVTMGAVAGFSAFERSVRSAASVGLDFGKSLAQMGERANMTADKLAKVRKQMYDLGSKTGANLPSLPAAGASLLGAVGGNADKAMSLLEPIAKAAGAENGDAAGLTEQIKSILKGEGRDLTKENVTSLLQSGFAAKSGGDFSSMDEYLQTRMAGVQGVNGRAGLTDKDYASIYGAASQTGTDKETSLAAIQGLIRQSASGWNGVAIQGLLGTNFMKNGKFDMGSLSKASKNISRSGMSDANLINLLSSGGLSQQEATGTLALLRGNGDFQKRAGAIQGNNKSFDQSVGQATDNVSDDLHKLQNSIIKATDQVFSPMGGVASKAMHGTLGAGDVGKALLASGQGLMDNKGVVAGGLAMSAISGMLTKKLGLMGGVMVGNKLKEQGVQPVYVTNVGEFDSKSNGVDDFLGKTGMMAGGVAGTEVAGAGWLSKLKGFGGSALAATPLGIGGGQALNGAFPELQGDDPYTALKRLANPQKVVVEITSKDPAFAGKPKSTDKATSARGP